MSTRKHHREFLRRIKSEFPGITAALLRTSGHYVYELAYQGHTFHHAAANSPRDTHHAIDNSIKQIRRVLTREERK